MDITNMKKQYEFYLQNRKIPEKKEITSDEIKNKIKNKKKEKQ